MLPHSKASTQSLMALDALPLQITMFFLVQSCLKLAKKEKNDTNTFCITTLFTQFLSCQLYIHLPMSQDLNAVVIRNWSS